jgi:hypothetical protein
LLIVGLPGVQPVTVITHQFQEKGRIAGITFGFAGDKGMTVAREAQRVDRIEHHIPAMYEEV